MTAEVEAQRFRGLGLTAEAETLHFCGWLKLDGYSWMLSWLAEAEAGCFRGLGLTAEAETLHFCGWLRLDGSRCLGFTAEAEAGCFRGWLRLRLDAFVA